MTAPEARRVTAVTAVPRVAPTAVDPGTLDAATTPIIVAGGARELPAAQRWSVAYLQARLAGVEVCHKRSRNRAHPDFTAPTLGEMFATRRAPFDALLATMTTGPVEERARVLFTGDEHPLIQIRDGVRTESAELAPLLADIEVPALVPAARLYTVWAWFSGPGVRTWLHYDNNGCHNLNAQITGRKRFALFAPEHVDALAMWPPGGPNPAHNCSQIDVDAPPAGFAEIPRWEGTLETHDLLFIPAWWIHTFEHLGDFNSNVNFWWRPANPPDNAVARYQGELGASTNVPLNPNASLR